MHTRFLDNLFEEFSSEIAIIWKNQEHTYGSLIEKIEKIVHCLTNSLIMSLLSGY